MRRAKEGRIKKGTGQGVYQKDLTGRADVHANPHTTLNKRSLSGFVVKASCLN